MSSPQDETKKYFGVPDDYEDNKDTDNPDNGYKADDLPDTEGGFHDVASFRSEMGLGQGDISDYDAQKIVDENRQQAFKSGTNIGEFLTYDLEQQQNKVKQQEREMEKMREEMNKLKVDKSSYNDDWRKIRDLKDDLWFEKHYGKNNFYYTSPSILDDYLKKERLKREVKEELITEKNKKNAIKNCQDYGRIMINHLEHLDHENHQHAKNHLSEQTEKITST